MLIQTMAVKITRDTYSIAVACLAGGFAAYPFREVEGHYLVINEITPTIVKKKQGERPIVAIGNSWMPAKMFWETYDVFDAEALDTEFTLVSKK